MASNRTAFSVDADTSLSELLADSTVRQIVEELADTGVSGLLIDPEVRQLVEELADTGVPGLLRDIEIEQIVEELSKPISLRSSSETSSSNSPMPSSPASPQHTGTDQDEKATSLNVMLKAVALLETQKDIDAKCQTIQNTITPRLIRRVKGYIDMEDGTVVICGFKNEQQANNYQRKSRKAIKALRSFVIQNTTTHQYMLFLFHKHHLEFPQINISKNATIKLANKVAYSVQTIPANSDLEKYTAHFKKQLEISRRKNNPIFSEEKPLPRNLKKRPHDAPAISSTNKTKQARVETQNDNVVHPSSPAREIPTEFSAVKSLGLFKLTPAMEAANFLGLKLVGISNSRR